MRKCKPHLVPPYAIAIDFDGCLFKDAWPDTANAKPIWRTINKALRMQRKGAKLILWTCRGGAKLLDAVIACRGVGLVFDAVNENLPEWNDIYSHDSRKVGADLYIDDKAKRMGG